MERLKNAFYAAGTIGLAAAIAFVALVFIGGALAVAGVVIAAMILVGGIMSLFGRKPFVRYGARRDNDVLTVEYTRLDDRDADQDRRSGSRR